MAQAQRSILLVGLTAKTSETATKILQRHGYFSEVSPTVETALESISYLPFDAIVVACPPPDRSLSEFLDAVRRKDSPCRQAGVVVLASAGALTEAQDAIGHGANRAIAVEEIEGTLSEEMEALFAVPPRIPVRALSRLKVQLSWGTSHTLCQTENLSLHGMLVKTDHPYPIGTQMAFELTVPGEGEPVRGYGVVVRHTQATRERTSGVGVRFSSFQGNDKKRLTAALQALAG